MVIHGIAIAGYIIAGLLFLFGIAVLIWALAKNNLFVTIVQEGRAKAILYNGAFRRVVMSYRGYYLDDEWNVRPVPPHFWNGIRIPFLSAIKWIGFPPFATPHWYKFRWTSLERSVNDKGEPVTRLDHKEERIDYVLVQPDTYVFGMMLVECADNIPLNIGIIMTGAIVNPEKALFKVQHWLETVQNELDPAIRPLVGRLSYDRIRQEAGTPGGDSELEEDPDIKLVIARALNDFGFRCDTLRIGSVNPGSPLADEFIRATTVVAVARYKADADVEEGRGQKSRAEQIYATVAAIPGGAEMYKWDRIKESDLTTLALGGADARPIIGVGGTPIPPTPRQPTVQPPQTAAPDPAPVAGGTP